MKGQRRKKGPIWGKGGIYVGQHMKNSPVLISILPIDIEKFCIKPAMIFTTSNESNITFFIRVGKFWEIKFRSYFS